MLPWNAQRLRYCSKKYPALHGSGECSLAVLRAFWIGAPSPVQTSACDLECFGEGLGRLGQCISVVFRCV